MIDINNRIVVTEAIFVAVSVILPFILDPTTGLVNVSAKLDREQQQLFVLIVEVAM